MAQAIKVLVTDDHSVVRSGLVNILGAEPDIEVVGEARDGVEAINKAPRLKPDVILMDIFMPHCSGLEALAAIREKNPDARILILTVSEQEENLLRALRFGAQGYLLKAATTTEIVDAVRRTAAGEVMLSPGIAAKLVAEFRQKVNEPELSSREMQVLELVGEGLTNAEIAHRIFISESTVRTYLGRVLDKLHLKNRAEAIAYATRHHLETTPL
jgi:Response regulator containing a CheY-like receiver domain and an HTH DNA-binding domain